MLKEVVKTLKARTDLPVEVSEIAAAIIAYGCTDTIHFKGVDGESTSTIHGAFWRYMRQTGVYAESELVSLIPYNNGDTLPWQRVTCAKEMVHIFDSDLERTDEASEVVDLLDRLLGRMSTDDFGIVDLMASKDKLALYYCLPLLLPKAALDQARSEVDSGRMTAEEVAKIAMMPTGLVQLMLNIQWDTLNGQLEAIG